MDELIVSFVNDNFTPELSTVILDLADTLEQMGNDEIQSVLLNYINNVEHVGIQQVIDNITLQLDLALNQTLLTFGVESEYTESLVWRFELLKDLIKLEDLDDVGSALNILNSTESNESKLAEVLEYITDIDSSEYLINFSRVNPSLIVKLKEIYEYTLANSQPIPDEDDEVGKVLKDNKRKILNTYREYTHDEIGLAGELINVNLPFLLPFTRYLEMITNAKEDITLEEYSKTLIVFAIMCGEQDTLFNIVRNHMEDLDDDPIEAIKIEAYTRKAITEFQMYANRNGSVI